MEPLSGPLPFPNINIHETVSVKKTADIIEIFNKFFHIKFSKPDSPFIITNFEVAIIGEMHTDAIYSQLNAKIIDYLWEFHRQRVILFTEDGAPAGEKEGQAEFVNANVHVSRWDISKPKELEDATRGIFEGVNFGISELINIQNKLNQLLHNKFEISFCENVISSCNNLLAQVRTKLLIYTQELNRTQNIRDDSLKNLIINERGKNRGNKIIIIAGEKHVEPFIEFLKEGNFSSFALVPIKASDKGGSKNNNDLEMKERTREENYLLLNEEISKLKQIKLATNIEAHVACNRILYLVLIQIQFCISFLPD